ncbi:hypothetical protein C8R43DRAFT_1240342 [Mycena crocata]|nr:hypothetical protein C8R43DRAFT_1240342 [Mycena crocata]
MSLAAARELQAAAQLRFDTALTALETIDSIVADKEKRLDGIWKIIEERGLKGVELVTYLHGGSNFFTASSGRPSTRDAFEHAVRVEFDELKVKASSPKERGSGEKTV